MKERQTDRDKDKYRKDIHIESKAEKWRVRHKHIGVYKERKEERKN